MKENLAAHPKLTIITPVLNGERFMESCLLNVRDQQCPDLEHLVIDNGSTDRTVGIVRAWQKRLPYVRLVSEPRKGLSRGLNHGVREARGKIISILNVDDFYEPGVLNEFLSIFPNLPEPSLVVGNCRVLDGDDKEIYINVPNKISYYHLLAGAAHPVNPSAYFYHKSLHDVAGLYDENEKNAMDLDFLIRAVRDGHVTYVNKLWGNYRVYPETLTGQAMATGRLKENNRRIISRYYDKENFLVKMSVRALKFSRSWIYKMRLFGSPYKHKFIKLLKGSNPR